MKLATYQDASRGGRLVVVSRDLSTAHYATGMANTLQQALDAVRLLVLASNLCLRSVGEVQGRPATAFGPVAVTLDEAGDAWHQGRLHLSLQTSWNGRKVGLCDAGASRAFHFGQLVSQLCKTRPVRAADTRGAGPVSHPDRSQGCHCIAEKRAVETADHGKPTTRFMQLGDTLRMDMEGQNGPLLFGAIAQEIKPPDEARLPAGRRVRPRTACRMTARP